MIKITAQPLQESLIHAESSPVDTLCASKLKLVRQIILELGAATSFYVSAYLIDQKLYQSVLLSCALLTAMKASCSLYELKKLDHKIDQATGSHV